MEMNSVVIIFIGVMILCLLYMIRYQQIRKTRKKLWQIYDSRSLVRFENEMSPLHTIVYGGTGTGKTYFVRQYLKLYQGQDQDLGTCSADLQSSFAKETIIIVYKDERDWINPETGKIYSGFNISDINMITSRNLPNFKDSVIFLDDMGDKLIKDIAYNFTKGRHHNI